MSSSSQFFLRPAATIQMLSPTIAFLLVSFSLGELGDGLNIFQGIYLVNLGWNEGAVGTALSLMGFTALAIQTIAGDVIDKTSFDRRKFLSVASIATALSASMIFFVQPGNSQHGLIFVSKIIEGVSSSFIGPCLGALTLATFGPHHFDAVMASNALWGHIGSCVAAVLAGVVAYFMYPDIKYCFLVIAASALSAVFLVQFLPEGDRLMGRGFQGKQALDEFGHVEQLTKADESNPDEVEKQNGPVYHEAPQAITYWEVISDKRCFLLCFTGFFFQ
jgi:MFS family permease